MKVKVYRLRTDVCEIEVSKEMASRLEGDCSHEEYDKAVKEAEIMVDGAKWEVENLEYEFVAEEE